MHSPTSAKVRGRRRIKEATGVMVAASVLLTGGAAALITVGVHDTTVASTQQTSTNTGVQVQSGTGNAHAASAGS